MSGFRLESEVDAISKLRFGRFPTKPFEGKIVRQLDLILGKPTKGWVVYTTYGTRYEGRYGRRFIPLRDQLWNGGLTTLLQGLIKLGEITKADKEAHELLLKEEQERKNFEELCRELVSFTKNDEILQKIAHHTDENLETLLTSDDKKEREFASAVVRLRERLLCSTSFTDGVPST